MYVFGTIQLNAFKVRVNELQYLSMNVCVVCMYVYMYICIYVYMPEYIMYYILSAYIICMYLCS